MQAVRHYSRTWPIDAVPAKVAARAALLVLWASPTDPEQQAVRRWLMSRVLAAAVSVAAELVEQAVQHYPRMWLIAAVPANVAARAAMLVSLASSAFVARSTRHRLSALLLVFAAVAAEAASECAAAEAGATATDPERQAVQC